MIQDLRLHGSIGIVDFFAFAAGADTHNTYFYEEEPSRIRFFSRGNEFTITEDHVMHRGSGGSFCEYMFGVGGRCAAQKLACPRLRPARFA